MAIVQEHGNLACLLFYVSVHLPVGGQQNDLNTACHGISTAS